MSGWNDKIIAEFRENEGKVGGMFEGRALLLLHTLGAKSGLERINPLAYMTDDSRYIVIASKGGAPTNPDWYHNIVANSEVSVEVGTEQLAATATIAAEPERTQLYEKMESINPGFAEYKSKTTRRFPVVILEKKS